MEKKREWKGTQLRWREMQKLMRGFMALKRLLLKEEKKRSRLLLYGGTDYNTTSAC